jgi:acetyl-CoA synthetase (ADP-forming)
MGLIRDAQFGPCVMFGLGGIFTEILKDTAFRVAPLSEADAESMLDELRAKGILDEFRGSPAVDRSSLASALVRLGSLAMEYPEIAEIDINPIIVCGNKPVAVDALVVLSRSN